MKIPIQWLSEYINITASPHELAQMLTMSGTEVSGIINIGENWKNVGKIPLYQVPNPSGMTSLGNNMLLENEASGKAVAGNPDKNGYGQVINYALEGSNVDLASELTHLIRLQRFFDVTTQTIQQSDTMLSQAVRIRQ